MERTDRRGSRQLAPDELRALVLSLGTEPQTWRERVRHHPEERVFEQLHLDEHVGVWLICWMPGHDTGFHDHDISAGAFTVTAGRLCEERLRFGGPADRVVLSEGQSASFTPLDIHRVMHVGDEPAVSLHAYSPPLVRMGSYLVEPGGALRRLPLGPVEELRPLRTA